MENNNQFELYDYARRRVKQKKRLYFHFILFLVGSVFLIIINKFLHIGEQYNWFVWAITAWAFLFILHVIRVFITESFMNKNWEKQHIEKLVALQQKKIQKLEKQVEDNTLKNDTL
ncbi:2TM domain-containing protein [Flavobacterium sp. '19STA2R22 D10 B1']|uniref:2TM domain-containing protein n=1 Tax=Flavobacterium aerium TaxID=3037261 RepID=UPI00278BBF13|nr:2TM domain-containing protein [Flavobacterium sp. '19STA2R22 D10 B1']